MEYKSVIVIVFSFRYSMQNIRGSLSMVPRRLENPIRRWSVQWSQPWVDDCLRSLPRCVLLAMRRTAHGWTGLAPGIRSVRSVVRCICPCCADHKCSCLCSRPQMRGWYYVGEWNSRFSEIAGVSFWSSNATSRVSPRFWSTISTSWTFLWRFSYLVSNWARPRILIYVMCDSVMNYGTSFAPPTTFQVFSFPGYLNIFSIRKLND